MSEQSESHEESAFLKSPTPTYGTDGTPSIPEEKPGECVISDERSATYVTPGDESAEAHTKKGASVVC